MGVNHLGTPESVNSHSALSSQAGTGEGWKPAPAEPSVPLAPSTWGDRAFQQTRQEITSLTMVLTHAADLSFPVQPTLCNNNT